MSDESELKRISETHGLGDVIYDEETDLDELKELLTDLGVDIKYGANTPD